MIAATNQPLEEMIRQGLFRDDLYYRLNVIPLLLPPLRERAEDIPDLVAHFLERANREHGKSVSLTPETIELLRRHTWPGNIRELENFIERLVVLSPGGPVRPENIVLGSLKAPAASRSAGIMPKRAAEAGSDLSLAKIEREKILEALARAGGFQSKAAKMLGLTRRQLGCRMRKFGIARREPTFE